MEIVNPHDKFFKETFSDRENVVDFVHGIFPDDLLECLDLRTLRVRPGKQNSQSYMFSFQDLSSF